MAILPFKIRDSKFCLVVLDLLNGSVLLGLQKVFASFEKSVDISASFLHVFTNSSPTIPNIFLMLSLVFCLEDGIRKISEILTSSYILNREELNTLYSNADF